MKKGAIVALVFSGILILCSIGLIIGSFYTFQPQASFHQFANGYMFSMGSPYAMGMNSHYDLMLLLLGCTFLNTGVILLALATYLLVKDGKKQAPRVIVEPDKPRETVKVEVAQPKKENLDGAIEVGEKA
ncbi:hypothetical protein [uncultured Sphaerochaeta sp.]|uniref:hypothetical protein n=1 Tax=uncultured Sphaerochaeta sp. TaxID=886478 RepID=UPI002A0A603E|nr:hypothetical protein [uncultured Sphaerochaeta sp.]